jgi:predicted RecA/RadA family phage recombinase
LKLKFKFKFFRRVEKMSGTTFRQAGEQLDYTPASAVASGALVQRGLTVGHASRDIAASTLDALQVEGVIRVPKASATVFSVAGAAPVHWNSGTSLAVTTKGLLYLGSAVGGGADGDTYVDVKLNDACNDATVLKCLRVRATIAEVNAGLTLLPAIPGRSYRLHDAAMISIGGAAATATTVDILATQSASSVKLLAVAVAALTQNALVRAGATNATILAGGVSFVANDANTAVTLSKTGSNVATATHIDVLLWYSLE